MCLLHILYFFVIACGLDGDTASEVHLTKWILRLIMVQMITYVVFAAIFAFNFVRELLSNKKRRRNFQIVPDRSVLVFNPKTNKMQAKSEFQVKHVLEQQDLHENPLEDEDDAYDSSQPYDDSSNNKNRRIDLGEIDEDESHEDSILKDLDKKGDNDSDLE